MSTAASTKSTSSVLINERAGILGEKNAHGSDKRDDEECHLDGMRLNQTKSASKEKSYG